MSVDPSLAASASTLCVVLGAAVRTAMKEHRAKQNPPESPTLRRIDAKLDTLEAKFDDFTREQRITNVNLHEHIVEVDHIVRGVDGENGQRSKLTALTHRVDTLERRPLAAADVGTYAPPGGRR
jgi:hypothetical protein